MMILGKGGYARYTDYFMVGFFIFVLSGTAFATSFLMSLSLDYTKQVFLSINNKDEKLKLSSCLFSVALFLFD